MKIPYIPEKKVKEWLKLETLIPFLKKILKNKNKKSVQMPSKSYLFFNKEEGDLRIMPCYLEDIDLAGIKIVNVHLNNPKKYKLETVEAAVFLYNPKNGQPICYMDATYLTALRTSAIAAIAADILSNKSSRTVSMIGGGVQAIQQLEGLLLVRDIREVKVFSKDIAPLKKFKKHFVNHKINITVEPDIKEACKNTDIVVTVTPSTKYIIKESYIKPGTHINAIGADAPGKQEIDPLLLKKCKIVVDDREQAIHGGEINLAVNKGLFNPDNISGEIDDAIKGKIKRRKNDITLFDSTGLAIQDISACYFVYKEALKNKFI